MKTSYKSKLLLSTALLAMSCPAIASEQVATVQDASVQAEEVVVLSPMEQDISVLQTEWARIKYELSDKERQLNAIHSLEEKAAKITAKYAGNAEPKIWEGIIISTDAGISGGLSALGKVKTAKKLFESALKINPKALDGSAYTSLGSLYYQVPSWPIGFGDDEKAEEYLKKALKMNPNGIDPNYFYGDFLAQDGREKEARVYLERALQAADRPSRPLADAGRRQEIKAALAKL
ncbi:MAG: tetratricopeptide repeat protein [Alcanivorax sp.]